ncbi:cysteine-rich PDZ-binding protein, partial [Tremellales sp. Uapishka_1]
MVCKKCEKKTSTVAAPDPFQPSSSTRKIGENKLLSARARAAPYVKPGAAGVSRGKINPYGNKCLDCKQSTQQNSATRCQKCAYKKGLCAICGVLILDTTKYKQSVK